MNETPIVLHQFRASHFNDKVRWTLACKGLVHERITYLPGPHQGPMKKLSGQTSTPVADIGGRIVAGSAAIIDALEQLFPAPPLFPADPAERAQALEIQSRLDRDLGPATRTMAFTVFVKELGYVARLFGGEATPLQRGLYRIALPLVKPIMAKTNGVTDPENVNRCIRITQEALDWIAEQTAQRKFLVGGSFSIADLTAAALLSPIMQLEHPDMRPAAPVPSALEGMWNEWRGHPAIHWAQGMYRDYRPADAG
jgi:glutathione S-transferase